MERRTFIRLGGMGVSALLLPSYTRTMQSKPHMYDTIIIGGSYAGLSAAMALGRSLRKVLVVDANEPCNRFTPASHNFLTQDGVAPGTIATIAQEQVMRYPSVTFQQGTVTTVGEAEKGFEVRMADGSQAQARKIILATGVRDLLPDMPGFADCWGRTVIHCPYCHGYEVRNTPTGILATGDTALHMVPLIRNWTKQLSLFTNGPHGFTPEQLGRIEGMGVRVHASKVQRMEHQGGQLKTVVTDDGTAHALNTLYARVPFELPGNMATQLGCKLTEQGHVEVSGMKRTSVPGVYAGGDITTPFRSVAEAVAAGNIAGAMLNMELITEENA